MKEFDLEKAKAGAPLITSGGRPARFLGEREHPRFPIIALVKEREGLEEVYTYTRDGRNMLEEYSNNDLFMEVEKQTLWANVYSAFSVCHVGQTLLYPSKEEALENIVSKKDYTYVDTVEIEVEV